MISTRRPLAKAWPTRPKPSNSCAFAGVLVMPARRRTLRAVPGAGGELRLSRCRCRRSLGHVTGVLGDRIADELVGDVVVCMVLVAVLERSSEQLLIAVAGQGEAAGAIDCAPVSISSLSELNNQSHEERTSCVGSLGCSVRPINAHASYPPTRSDTSWKPWATRRLAAIDERYPPAPSTT